MATKKLKNRPQEVDKTPEVATTAQRTVTWIQENPRWVAWSTAGLVLILVSVWGVFQYRESRERSAGAEYVRILADWPKSEAVEGAAW